MGETGARFSDDVGAYATEVAEVMEPLGAVTWKKMFGGAGIFIDGSMFGLIDSEAVLHLKVDDSNRQRYESADASKHSRMPYYSVPTAVLESDSDLIEWARLSAEIVKG